LTGERDAQESGGRIHGDSGVYGLLSAPSAWPTPAST